MVSMGIKAGAEVLTSDPVVAGLSRTHTPSQPYTDQQHHQDWCLMSAIQPASQIHPLTYSWQGQNYFHVVRRKLERILHHVLRKYSGSKQYFWKYRTEIGNIKIMIDIFNSHAKQNNITVGCRPELAQQRRTDREKSPAIATYSHKTLWFVTHRTPYKIITVWFGCKINT